MHTVTKPSRSFNMTIMQPRNIDVDLCQNVAIEHVLIASVVSKYFTRLTNGQSPGQVSWYRRVKPFQELAQREKTQLAIMRTGTLKHERIICTSLQSNHHHSTLTLSSGTSLRSNHHHQHAHTQLWDLAPVKSSSPITSTLILSSETSLRSNHHHPSPAR